MTREIILDKKVVSDDWQTLRLVTPEGETLSPESVEIPAGNVLVPLQVWKLQRSQLLARLHGQQNIGVWFASDEQAKLLGEDIALFSILAIDFPKFTDGRGYSIAYNLRTRFVFKGQLRALGDVLRDQLFFMQRVGFNAFEVRADKNIHDALKSLSDFSSPYQTSVDEKNPLFRRVDRNGVAA
jgi:uncharacterized protein (DUF934 family)